MRGSAVDLNIRLEAVIRQEGTAWLASCPSLDVVTQDESRQGALEAIKEAVQLWFESAVERGVLDQALIEAGFDRNKTGARLDGRSDGEDYIEISIPAYTASNH